MENRSFLFVDIDEKINAQCKDCYYFSKSEEKKELHFCLKHSQFYPCLTRRDTNACKSFKIKK